MSHKYPTLIDAGLTQTMYRKHDEEKWGPRVKQKMLQTFGEYKYQLLLDGTVAAFRAPGLFLQDSLGMSYERIQNRVRNFRINIDFYEISSLFNNFIFANNFLLEFLFFTQTLILLLTKTSIFTKKPRFLIKIQIFDQNSDF